MKSIIYLLCLLASLHSMAQSKKPVKVLLLGTFHFDNPGLDVAKFENANILSEKRQQQVMEIQKMLKAFAPDRIFIEASPESQSKIDSAYLAYKSGNAPLKASETQQLGFRLAKELDLPTLYGVDYYGADFPFDSLMKSATEAGQTDLLNYIQESITKIQEMFNNSLAKMTIREMLLRENSEEMYRLQHSFYFKLLPAGKVGNHVGSYLVSEWWRRNMVIYENIMKRLTGKEERVLVIFGAGHTAILQELMKYNPDIELVPVSKVLKGN